MAVRRAGPPQVTYRLADLTELHQVDGRWILFSERRQKLFELNDAAACLACRLSDGATYESLLDDLLREGLDHANAAAGIREMLMAWSKEDLAVADCSFTSDPYEDWQSIELAGLTTSVSYGTRQLSAKIAPSFQHLQADLRPGSTAYELVSCGDFALISRNREPAAIMAAQQAAPTLKTFLTEDILHAWKGFTALHAACLAHKQHALLLCGSPGAGKSTLSVALEATGFAYGGDDITLMDHSGLVRGVDFAFTAKERSWQLLREFRSDLRDHQIHRRLDGKRVRYLPPLYPGLSDWMPVRWIIRLRRRSGVPSTLIRRGRVDALSDLLGEAYSKSGRTRVEDLHMLLDVLSDVQCYELQYSDLNEAVRALGRMCADA